MKQITRGATGVKSPTFFKRFGADQSSQLQHLSHSSHLKATSNVCYHELEDLH